MRTTLTTVTLLGAALALWSCRDHSTGDVAPPAVPAAMAFEAAVIVSEEAPFEPAGAAPGEAAFKGRILRLTQTAQELHDGRLVVVYGDANALHEVWDPKGLTHRARDIFVRYSDNEGLTWSDPVNLSNTAQAYSAHADWDGDGIAEECWGDSGKPTVYSHGDRIVVSWIDKYCPEADWVWGDPGESSVQGRASYPDLGVPLLEREIPYSGVHVAISMDSGNSWLHGGSNPPLQLTYGRRDAIQDVHRGSGKKWVMTWQEDPEGLQPGEADGPGTGASGAKTTKGTDIWYTFTPDITTNPLALRDNRTPLSNNSEYDTTASNGYPLVGMAGAVENHGASRANLFLVKEQDTFRALAVYEESKGLPDIAEGKTIQYHCFELSQPVLDGPAEARCGDPGSTLSNPQENGRRARIVAQSPDGATPAVAILWRQSFETEGGPADILLKTSPILDPEAVAAAPTWNMSSETLTGDADHLGDPTDANVLEDARAHRAILRGDFIAVAYVYTPNGPLARYTDQANYELHVRRSFDGGLSWTAADNISQLPTTLINVKEPRLVPTPKATGYDPQAFVVAWGTETNVYEGLEEPRALDIEMTRTFDRGETYEPIATFPGADGTADASHYESQIRLSRNGRRIYGVCMEQDPSGVVNLLFARHELP